jgi:hypothetical protein
VISTAVTVITVGGTDTLVIDLPAGSYTNACKYCVVVAQTIPSTATINMPVAFSIGGDTTVVYPFINCNCVQVTACGIRTRTKYPVVVFTNTTSDVFRSTRHICCYPADNLTSIPAPAAATTFAAVEIEIAPATATRKTATKEATKNE